VPEQGEPPDEGVNNQYLSKAVQSQAFFQDDSIYQQVTYKKLMLSLVFVDSGQHGYNVPFTHSCNKSNAQFTRMGHVLKLILFDHANPNI